MNTDRLDLLTLTYLWCARGKPATADAVAKALADLVSPGNPAAAADIVRSSLDRLTGRGDVVRTDPPVPVPPPPPKVPKKPSNKPPKPPRAAKPAKPSTFAVADAGGRRAAAAFETEAPPKTFNAAMAADLPALAVGLSASARAGAKGAAVGKLRSLAICGQVLGARLPLDRGLAEATLALVRTVLARHHSVPPDQVPLKKLPAGDLPSLVVGPALGLTGTHAVMPLDKLVGAVAKRTLGVTSDKQVNAAIVRRWLAEGGAPQAVADRHEPSAATPATHAAPAAPMPAVPASSDGPIDANDVAAFARAALYAARAVARDGGPGVSSLGDKVLVAHAWRRHQQQHPHLPLEQFKRLLVEAAGEHLHLAKEDLVPADRRAEFEESAVRVGASVYHYVRVT